MASSEGSSIGRSVICVAVMFARYNVRASYYDDWLDAFRKSALYSVVELNIFHSYSVSKLRRLLRDVDLVVLLHSTNADHTFYLEPLAPILADRCIPLVSFVGNEVSLPGIWIADKRRVLELIKPDYIATQLPLEAGEYLWGDLVSKRVIALPHALNPDVFYPTIQDSERVRDLGVRAFKYPPHLGDNDRNRLLEYVKRFATEVGLSVDFGEARLDRTGWAEFLNQSRGTVSTEAGSWYLSRDDSLIREFAESLRQTRRKRWVISSDNHWLRRMVHRLPWWAHSLLAAAARKSPLGYEGLPENIDNTDEIIRDFFQDKPKAPVYSRCISSRHFEAAGTGTVQLLQEGRYNDILTANVHYISVKQDFSNVAEVLELFGDPLFRKEITETAREHVLANHTYSKRVEALAYAL